MASFFWSIRYEQPVVRAGAVLAWGGELVQSAVRDCRIDQNIVAGCRVTSELSRFATAVTCSGRKSSEPALHVERPGGLQPIAPAALPAENPDRATSPVANPKSPLSEILPGGGAA